MEERKKRIQAGASQLGKHLLFFFVFAPTEPAVHNTYLLVSFEVSLLKRLVEPRLRVWDSGVASWDKLGEAGGPLYVAVRRSRGWP